MVSKGSSERLREGGIMEGFAHCSSRSSMKYGWPYEPRQRIWDQL